MLNVSQDDNKSRKVVIVDDDDVFASLHTEILRAVGCNVEMFTDPAKFLEKAQSHFKWVNQIFVLLLDLDMSINGEEIVKYLRQNHQDAPIYIIIFSGNLNYDNKKHLVSIGVDDYYEKGTTNPQDIVNKIVAKYNRQTYDSSIGSINNTSELKEANIRIDDNQKIVYVNETNLQLTPSEYKIFITLSHHLNKFVRANEINDVLFANPNSQKSDGFRVYIKKINDKLIDANLNHSIKIVGKRYVGWSLTFNGQ
ncbi:MAG: response regulator [Candidatus Ancillula sp.]|jgi:DNA-binding response OmpR family regulator|nr:response regulator [Candidatus Ancillula sp.]